MKVIFLLISVDLYWNLAAGISDKITNVSHLVMTFACNIFDSGNQIFKHYKKKTKKLEHFGWNFQMDSLLMAHDRSG